jgi:hypothetical protein
MGTLAEIRRLASGVEDPLLSEAELHDLKGTAIGIARTPDVDRLKGNLEKYERLRATAVERRWDRRFRRLAIFWAALVAGGVVVGYAAYLGGPWTDPHLTMPVVLGSFGASFILVTAADIWTQGRREMRRGESETCLAELIRTTRLGLADALSAQELRSKGGADPDQVTMYELSAHGHAEAGASLVKKAKRLLRKK